MDIETSLAQEIRINNENEAMARDYTRRLMKMKHMTLQKIKNQSGETKNQAMVDLIEQGLDLQIEFQEQYCGLTNPDEWRIREPMNNSEDESQNQEPDVIEEEKAPSIVKRKSPEKQPVMEAHCESVSVAEVQEELEAIEEAEVEMAIKMSMQDLEIQPLDDLQSQIAEEAHDTKPAALSNEELAKMKKHEEDLLAQEQVRRQEEQEQIERDVAELIPENTSILNNQLLMERMKRIQVKRNIHQSRMIPSPPGPEATGRVTGRILKSGTDPWGRFTWILFRGNRDEGILFISAYRVCQKKEPKLE
ncbi:hypothetical protein ACHAXN_007193 [Cyclotella atomus]